MNSSNSSNSSNSGGSVNHLGRLSATAVRVFSDVQSDLRPCCNFSILHCPTSSSCGLDDRFGKGAASPHSLARSHNLVEPRAIGNIGSHPDAIDG
eukprot:scaffold8567_cov277-Pinguiococcus_pyrenoidosus.AAC.4